MSDIREQQPAARPRYRVSSMAGAHIDDVEVAGYALGALEPAERQVIEHHIRTCATCATRVAADLRTVGMLPFAVPAQLKPAPDVKAALFSRIAHSQQAAAHAAVPTAVRKPSLPTLPSSRPGAAAPIAAAGTVPTLAAPGRTRASWLTAVVATPLLLALVLVGGWSLNLRQELASQSTTLESQSSELTTLRASLASFGTGDVQRYEMQPQAGAPQAEGQLLLSADQKDAIVRVDLNLQQAEGGSATVLMNNNGTIEPIAELEYDEKGQGQTAVSFAQPLSPGQSIVVQAVPVDSDVPGEPSLLLSGSTAGMGDPGLGANTAP